MTTCVVDIDNHHQQQKNTTVTTLTNTLNLHNKQLQASCKHLNNQNNNNTEKDDTDNDKFLKQLKLRSLSRDDVDMLKLLCGDWFPINYPDSWYQSITTNPKFNSLAATLDGEIVSILVSETKPRSQVNKEDSDLLSREFGPDSLVTYILSLGVHRNYRRLGVASFMIRNLINLTTVSSSSSPTTVGPPTRAIYLHVLYTNRPAIQFYQQHGFQMLHFLRYYYVIGGQKSHGFSYVLYVNGGRGRTSYWWVTECCHMFMFTRAYRASKFLLCKIFVFLVHVLGLDVHHSKQTLAASNSRQYRSL